MYHCLYNAYIMTDRKRYPMQQVYLIGNAHIDPVWLWRKTEGMSEILATFRSALDRMEALAGYILCSACSV